MPSTLDEAVQVLQESGQYWLTGMGAPMPSNEFLHAYQVWLKAMQEDPGQLARLQQTYLDEHFLILQRLLNRDPESPSSAAHDKRFAGEAWRGNPVLDYLAQSYLATTRLLNQTIDALQIDPAEKRRVRFFVRQYLDALAPSNYLATNPEALARAIETKGESLRVGMENLQADLEKGRISMTDETAFAVGKNIALSAGSVVFENEVMQLLQYRPLTASVHSRPLVIFPPCINKFYILDLRPQNSLVRFAVEQGHTVFMVSWRNVKAEQGHLTWDHYLAHGVAKAIDVARLITQQPKVNALGFCIGGTLLACTLSVLEAMGEDVVESLTLLASFLDFSDVGEIGAYIDRPFVEKREREVGAGGVVPGAELSFAFSSLRANELVWNYVVNNYLKGEAPPAFDLLYWNCDSTNLPGPMYTYYIRNAYLENKFAHPNELVQCGYPLDFGRINIPAFVFAAREDHIVPWRTAFRGAGLLGGEVKFVLGASGHIAGVVNPASANRRSYWTSKSNSVDYTQPDAWLRDADESPGSWWLPWARWLAPHAGRKVPAREGLGSAEFPPIEPAPGRYVREQA